jgi:uncharacterized membrane protein YidH (DUF202 family)
MELRTSINNMESNNKTGNNILIDEEISEIEILIELQMKKIELLRKRTVLTTDNDDKPAVNTDSTDPVKISATNPLFSKREESVSSDHSRQISIVEQTNVIDGMVRLNRLSTELANERNLLAWTRTALALCRTSIAYIGVVGINYFGDISQKICVVGCALLGVWFMCHSVSRYQKVKYYVSLKDPTLEMDRASNTLTILATISVLVLAFIVTASEDWQKQ